MTAQKFLNDVCDMTRMDREDTDDKTRIITWGNFALDEIAREFDCWFLEVDFEVTLSASIRRYALPTTDIYSNTGLVVMRMRQKSFRTATGRMPFQPNRETLDLEDPTWLDTTAEGNPGRVTIVGNFLVFDRIPSSDWIADNPKLYFSAFRRAAQMDVDALSTEIADIPAPWHDVISLGAQYRGEQRQGAKGWGNKREEFYNAVENMMDKSLPSTDDDDMINLPYTAAAYR